MTACIIEARGRTTRGGHKQVHVGGGKREYAHRLAWQEANGPIPDGMKIRHSCDNPPCINKEHLLLGTQADNVQDMDDRGRRGSLRGERGTASKLTEEQARAVLASTETHAALGRKYGVSATAISHIRTGRNWSHLQ